MDYVLAAAENLMEDSHSAAIQKRATIARPTNLPDSRTECGPGRPGQSAPPPGQACGILLNGGVVLRGLAPDGPACPPNANPSVSPLPFWHQTLKVTPLSLLRHSAQLSFLQWMGCLFSFYSFSRSIAMVRTLLPAFPRPSLWVTKPVC